MGRFYLKILKLFGNKVKIDSQSPDKTTPYDIGASTSGN